MPIFILFLYFANTMSSSKETDCTTPPETILFGEKNYLKSQSHALVEPGNKLGYMVCKQGIFQVSYDDDSQITVHHVPDSQNVLLLTKWGRILYQPVD